MNDQTWVVCFFCTLVACLNGGSFVDMDWLVSVLSELVCSFLFVYLLICGLMCTCPTRNVPVLQWHSRNNVPFSRPVFHMAGCTRHEFTRPPQCASESHCTNCSQPATVSQVTDWASDWLTDWVSDWLRDWMSDWLSTVFMGTKTSKMLINVSNINWKAFSFQFIPVVWRAVRCSGYTDLHL